MIYKTITLEKENGCVALKCAISYDRGLDIQVVSKLEAENSYSRLISGNINSDDIKVFQDYMFFVIAKVAADLNLPLQFHTGLSILPNSRAIYINELIRLNPQTKFVLFHGSYPYKSDIMALAHTYKNVYPDMCWLPIISSHAAKSFIKEIMDVAVSDTLCWGCDTLSGEESMGAFLAACHVLCSALADKVQDGLITEALAFQYINDVFYNNPNKLYFMGEANK